MIDLADLVIKRRRGRPADRTRLLRWQAVAMEYYRYLYLLDYGEAAALKNTEETFKPRVSMGTVKNAVSYYSDETREGRKRLMECGLWGHLSRLKSIGNIMWRYRRRGKPLPDWLSCYLDPR